MDSHTLAKMLLAHRNNDVRFSVHVEGDDEADKEVYAFLADHPDDTDNNNRLATEDVVYYDSLADSVIIKIGTVWVTKL